MITEQGVRRGEKMSEEEDDGSAEMINEMFG